jgi:hypothetical protein
MRDRERRRELATGSSIMLTGDARSQRRFKYK